MLCTNMIFPKYGIIQVVIQTFIYLSIYSITFIMFELSLGFE